MNIFEDGDLSILWCYFVAWEMSSRHFEGR